LKYRASIRMKARQKHYEKSSDELEEFKRFLGPIAEEYSDSQLRQLRREMYECAELLLDIYLHKEREGVSPKSRADFDQPSATA
jgi:hypothetical protein